MPVLTLIDTLAVQGYIFATHRLKDAVGGSALVKQFEDRIPEYCGSEAVLLSAGGNAILRFGDREEARTAVMRLSRKLYDDAPGLELAAVHHEYPSGGMANALLQAQRMLQSAKLRRQPGIPLLGLSATEPCRETRLPATEVDKEDDVDVPLSRLVTSRRQQGLGDVWRKFLPPDCDAFARDGGVTTRLVFPLKVEDLGRSLGDRSLLGLVHIDGNDIGRMLAKWLRGKADAETDDEQLIADLQRVSAAIRDLGEDALRRVVTRVVNAIRCNGETGEYEVRSSLGESFELRRSEYLGDALCLPIRPLILGGDDLTFLCDGRLALDLAETALGAFESEPARLPVLEKPVRACAGVAIGRAHTPVARLFHLAEELCRSAKQRVRDEAADACGLDWHIAFQSPVETLTQLRRRQYRVGDGADRLVLTERPYLLGAPETPARETWRWLSTIVLGTDAHGFRGERWSARRSKLKILRELVREGPDAVKDAMSVWAVTSPGLEFPAGVPGDGFSGRKTALLDAVELLDLHWPLEDRRHANT